MNQVITALAPDTKERILDAAEALFMEQGFSATSLRNITARAEVNLAAVNYHYGSKEELIRAVFTRRLGPLNKQRVEILDRMEAAAGGKPLSPERVLEAFLMAGMRLAQDRMGGGAVFLRLLGRTFAEPSNQIRSFLPEEYAEVVARYKAALARALPQLPERELVWRLHFIFGAISYTLGGTDVLKLTCNYPLEEEANQPEALVRHLVPFLAGGLTAPLPGEGGGKKSKRERSK
jgi:AcrR family transcriptional regulator